MPENFPNEREAKLGAAMVKYCAELAQSDRLDEAAAESMNIAMECLQQAFGIEDPNPKSDVDLLTAVCGEAPATEPTKPQDEQKSTDYCDFLWQIEQKGFFKDCEVGDSDYMARLEKARIKYNQRFPDAQIDPCSLSWEDRKSAAVTAKTEGNTALKENDFETAVKKYTEAIRLNSTEAAFYSNRSAAYLHLNQGDRAAEDANRAIQRRPEWTKGYMRLGGAKRTLKDYDGAIQAYRTALTKVSVEDPLWQQISENIEQCEKAKNPVPVPAMRGGNPMDMFSGLGGMGGEGGGMPNFAEMMNNPMMQQMAQQFMQDPNMMQKMSQMMQDPAMQDMARNMMGGMGPGGPASGAQDANFMQLMQDPVKMKEVLEKVHKDPEMQTMMETDTEAADILTRLSTGDSSAGMELLQKPELMGMLRKLVAKHM